MKTLMSELPGTSALVADYFDNFEKVAEFYNGDYRKPENFLHRSDTIKGRGLPLARLVPVLREQNQQFGCGFQTLEKIDWLLERRACAVVTGQQTGLFGGPLFTIYKTLTTIKLAERLSRTCEGCYVPVFWLASDDHDFREVNHVHLLDKANQLRPIVYEGHPADSRVPVSRVELNEDIVRALDELDEATHPSEFKEEVLARLSDAYHPGTVYSEAFARWLMTLFKPFGLIVIDASDVRIKGLARDLFQKEITERSPSTKVAIAASERLREHDYHAQVQVHDGLLNLFYAESERNAIQFDDGAFAIKRTQQVFQEADLLSQLEAHPEFFSPNVLLRPLYQDTLLPTIAYIAGTSEGAYYAQMKGIYEHFEIPMPVIFPRKSLTLLEAKIEKVLDRYELRVQDFWGDVERLVTAIVKAQLPEALEKRVAEAALCVNENLQALENTVQDVDPTLIDFVKNTRNRVQGQIDGLEKKVVQAYKKRHDVIRQQIYKAQHSLYPNHHLQERELNVVPFLFKHGFGFIDQLYEAMDISSFEHQIVRT
ncbi:MAG: bacillithiol biosynthesis cysteine-adding enzyme BshC [bacterium]